MATTTPLPIFAGPAPPVDSREFKRRAWRVQSHPNPDVATAQTVDIMCGHIKRSASDAVVRAAAVSAVNQYRGGPLWAMAGINPLLDSRCDTECRARVVAESVWWWAKHQLRFVHHSRLIEVWLNERDQLQLLISPDVLVRMRRMRGDCAIYSMLIPAMLDVLGVPWELVTLAVDPYQPRIFSHVYVRAILPSGRRLALDASHGQYPGWSVPRAHISRSQVWDENGAAVDDVLEGGAFDGLHGYTWNRGLTGYYGGFGGWGLGDDGGDGGTIIGPPDVFSSPPVESPGPFVGPPLIPPGEAAPIQTGIDSMGNPILASGTTLGQLGMTPTLSTDPSTGLQTATFAGTSGPATGYVAPAQGTSAWAAFASQLAKSGMQLAMINAIQPGTVVSANGAILRQAPGLPVPVGNSLSTSLGLSSNSGSLLLWGGGALLAILAVSSLRR